MAQFGEFVLCLRERERDFPRIEQFEQEYKTKLSKFCYLNNDGDFYDLVGDGVNQLSQNFPAEIYIPAEVVNNRPNKLYKAVK